MEPMNHKHTDKVWLDKMRFLWMLSLLEQFRYNLLHWWMRVPMKLYRFPKFHKVLPQ